MALDRKKYYKDYYEDHKKQMMKSQKKYNKAHREEYINYQKTYYKTVLKDKRQANKNSFESLLEFAIPQSETPIDNGVKLIYIGGNIDDEIEKKFNVTFN